MIYQKYLKRKHVGIRRTVASVSEHFFDFRHKIPLGVKMARRGTFSSHFAQLVFWWLGKRGRTFLIGLPRCADKTWQIFEIPNPSKTATDQKFFTHFVRALNFTTFEPQQSQLEKFYTVLNISRFFHNVFKRKYESFLGNEDQN